MITHDTTLLSIALGFGPVKHLSTGTVVLVLMVVLMLELKYTEQF